MNMHNWYRFWRRVAAFLLINTPLRSYGELVLRPVTIAERAVSKASAVSAGHNNS